MKHSKSGFHIVAHFIREMERIVNIMQIINPKFFGLYFISYYPIRLDTTDIFQKLLKVYILF